MSEEAKTQVSIRFKGDSQPLSVEMNADQVNFLKGEMTKEQPSGLMTIGFPGQQTLLRMEAIACVHIGARVGRSS